MSIFFLKYLELFDTEIVTWEFCTHLPHYWPFYFLQSTIFSTARQLINTVLTESRLNFCVVLGQQIPDQRAEWVSPGAVYKREPWTPHWYSVHGTQPNPLSDRQNGNKTNGPAERGENQAAQRRSNTDTWWLFKCKSSAALWAKGTTIFPRNITKRSI